MSNNELKLIVNTAYGAMGFSYNTTTGNYELNPSTALLNISTVNAALAEGMAKQQLFDQAKVDFQNLEKIAGQQLINKNIIDKLFNKYNDPTSKYYNSINKTAALEALDGMSKKVNTSSIETQAGISKAKEIVDLTSDSKLTMDKINGILAQKNLLSTTADMVGKSASIASVVLAGDAIKADGTGLGWDAPVAPYLNALLSNAIGLAVGGFSGAAVTVATGGNLVVGGIAGGAAGVASATLVSEAFKASFVNSFIGDVTFRELGNGLVDIGRDIDNLAKEISDQLHNSLDTLGKELSHGAEQLATGLADSANELGQAIAETASEVLNDIKTAIEETKSQIENAVKAITDTITDIFEGVKDLAKDLFDNSGIKELADEYLPDLIKDWLGLNREGQHYFYDPLVLDLDGDGIETIAHNKSNGAFFDNDSDGLKVATGWVKSDDGLLVFDRNGDGVINDGTEVFGDNTQLENGEKALHGFEALADLDSNKDGKIDKNDKLFDHLKIWRDLNHDGISQEGELFNLKDLEIKSLNLAYQDTNQTLNGNNLLTQIGSYEKEDGSIHKMGDVNFWLILLTELIST